MALFVFVVEIHSFVCLKNDDDDDPSTKQFCEIITHGLGFNNYFLL